MQNLILSSLSTQKEIPIIPGPRRMESAILYVKTIQSLHDTRDYFNKDTFPNRVNQAIKSTNGSSKTAKIVEIKAQKDCSQIETQKELHKEKFVFLKFEDSKKVEIHPKYLIQRAGSAKVTIEIYCYDSFQEFKNKSKAHVFEELIGGKENCQSLNTDFNDSSRRWIEDPTLPNELKPLDVEVVKENLGMEAESRAESTHQVLETQLIKLDMMKKIVPHFGPPLAEMSKMNDYFGQHLEDESVKWSKQLKLIDDELKTFEASTSRIQDECVSVISLLHQLRFTDKFGI